MAQFSMHHSIISRNAGQSSVASAAYRAGQSLFDERVGMRFDYTRKGSALESEIRAPEGAPAWVQDREKLWNAVEAKEDTHSRKYQAQLAREIRVSLPHELSDQERRDLVREFVDSQYVSQGMVADVAIHRADRRGDNRNHHAHIMLTMRRIDENDPTGFGKKAREWNLESAAPAREAFANLTNEYLERAGVPRSEWVDHRSLEEQRKEAEARGNHELAAKLDRAPTKHEGVVATQRLRKGDTEHPAAQRALANRAAVEAENAERAWLREFTQEQSLQAGDTSVLIAATDSPQAAEHALAYFDERYAERDAVVRERYLQGIAREKTRADKQHRGFTKKAQQAREAALKLPDFSSWRYKLNPLLTEKKLDEKRKALETKQQEFRRQAEDAIQRSYHLGYEYEQVSSGAVTKDYYEVQRADRRLDSLIRSQDEAREIRADWGRGDPGGSSVGAGATPTLDALRATEQQMEAQRAAQRQSPSRGRSPGRDQDRGGR